MPDRSTTSCTVKSALPIWRRSSLAATMNLPPREMAFSRASFEGVLDGPHLPLGRLAHGDDRGISVTRVLSVHTETPTPMRPARLPPMILRTSSSSSPFSSST